MRHVLVCTVFCLVSSNLNARPVEAPAIIQEGDSIAGKTDAGSSNEAIVTPPRDELMPVEYSRQELCDAIAETAQAYNLPVGFFARLIWQESGFKTQVVSRAGAQGIAQFMPPVAAEMGLDDPFDPTQALPASARLLQDLQRQFGNHGLAAAAYNAGSGRVANWLRRRSRLPNETRLYVLGITGQQPEQWIGMRGKVANVRVPLATQCRDLVEPVMAAQAARWTQRPARVRVNQAVTPSPVQPVPAFDRQVTIE